MESQRGRGRGVEALRLMCCGVCMGIANLIPGVSGGTVAFVFGIYEDVLQAVRAFDGGLLRLLWRRRWREAAARLPMRFLAPLALGILGAVFLGAGLIDHLLHHRPVEIHAFFFGLILATVPIIARVIHRWTPGLMLWAAASAAGMLGLVGLMPAETPENWGFLFLCGAVAVCTMILPGISGAFVLVLLGKYEDIITAVHERDWLPLSAVAAGCVVGLLLFVRVLSWLFRRWHDATAAFLTGMVLGSLPKVWPWKEVVEEVRISGGEALPLRERLVLPGSMDVQVWTALGLALIGFWIALRLAETSPRGRVRV